MSFDQRSRNREHGGSARRRSVSRRAAFARTQASRRTWKSELIRWAEYLIVKPKLFGSACHLIQSLAPLVVAVLLVCHEIIEIDTTVRAGKVERQRAGFEQFTKNGLETPSSAAACCVVKSCITGTMEMALPCCIPSRMRSSNSYTASGNSKAGSPTLPIRRALPSRRRSSWRT